MHRRFTNLTIPTGGNDTAAAEIVVRDGRFEAIEVGALPEAAADGATRENGAIDPTGAPDIIDLGGALVLPGVIDGHVHFDDPGFTHRENFATGTMAAAAGGVTCIVDMPCTSLPPVTTAANLRNKLEIISPKAHVDYMLWGGVSGNAMAEPGWRAHLADIVEAGVASIKIYMLSGMDTFTDIGRAQIRDVLAETHWLGVPVGVHAENRKLVAELTAGLRAMGRDAPLDYAASRPQRVEASAVTTICELSRETGARAHIVHLASAAALDVVTAAREAGVPISAETCPQYLEFTDEDLAAQGALLKTAPVVKSAADRDRLWQGLASGEIDYVATDHAAGEWPREKHTGSIWSDYGGVPGVELSLPYLYSEGVRRGRLSLERLTEVTASAPAQFFGIANRKGRLAPGLDADLVVFDPGTSWTVRAEGLHNLNRYTPLEGHELNGRVRSVYLRGQRVYHREPDGAERFGPAGFGQWLRRGQETR